jgi:formamidopyrimidine-DNA glycosylase
LPDITVYVDRLDAKVRGTLLRRIRVHNPFLLRTAGPAIAIASAEGRRVAGIERLGKRVVIALEGELFLVTRRRASLHLAAGGIDVMASDLPAFAAQLARENHTVKRSLTNPRLLGATRSVMGEWIDRLGAEADRHGGWPGKVTAFHPVMAAHGRFGQPCPDSNSPIRRIVHADNETNCARRQTGGKVLADRALSRLLKDSWPRHIVESG